MRIKGHQHHLLYAVIHHFLHDVGCERHPIAHRGVDFGVKFRKVGFQEFLQGAALKLGESVDRRAAIADEFVLAVRAIGAACASFRAGVDIAVFRRDLLVPKRGNGGGEGVLNASAAEFDDVFVAEEVVQELLDGGFGGGSAQVHQHNAEFWFSHRWRKKRVIYEDLMNLVLRPLRDLRMTSARACPERSVGCDVRGKSGL